MVYAYGKVARIRQYSYLDARRIECASCGQLAIVLEGLRIIHTPNHHGRRRANKVDT